VPVDILNNNVSIVAGVTEWRRIAAITACFDVRMASHEEHQITLHLLAAVPNGLCVEIFPNYERD
jgi:L-alanine-DL-glutamate epimerase-like enolase superfamily enzyme